MKRSFLPLVFRLRFFPKRVASFFSQYVMPRENYYFLYKKGGMRMFLGGSWGPQNSMLYYDPETYEKEMNPVLRVVLDCSGRPPAVIDVGANWGQTLFKVKLFCPRTVVHSFDAFPQMVHFLREMVKVNGWDDVFPHCLLLSSERKTAKIFFKKDSGMDTASTVEGFQRFFDSAVEADSITLDEFTRLKNIDHITLIKIDVEGGELEVIEGARETLERMKPDILLELLYSPGHRQARVIEVLQGMGYHFYHLMSNGELILEEQVTPDPAYRLLNYFVSLKSLGDLKKLSLKVK